MGYSSRWTSFRDYFCQLKRWASQVLDDCCKFEIGDCKAMTKSTHMFFYHEAYFSHANNTQETQEPHYVLS